MQDARDKRPMVYPGRLILGNNAEAFWAKSSLVTELRTAPVPQLASKDMDEIEDMSATLPSSTDDDDRVKGAQKYSQMGEKAAVAIFNALVVGDLVPITMQGGLFVSRFRGPPSGAG
jgi:hypothetical protein